jgi:hypothetical protein
MSGARPRRDAVVTIKVPFTVRKRGGRRLVFFARRDGVPALPARFDNTSVKALARAIPVAENAGDQQVRHSRRDRYGREDQLILR